MRKIFGGAMLFSAVGATILGGALAWQSTAVSPLQNVGVGALGFNINYTQAPDAQLGPNDGINNHIGDGTVDNTGDYNIAYKDADSWVEITNFTVPNGVPADHGVCNTTNFGGDVSPEGGSLNSIAPGANGVNGFNVDMNVATVAPAACMGGTVSYIVHVTFETIPTN
jgi:hypothetical protein